jgi:hypothetical protein
MKRRRLLLIVGVVVALGVLALLLWPRRVVPENRISQDGFERLEKGMTRQAVEEVLGVPPGDYVTEPVHFVRPVGQVLIADLRRPPDGPETEVIWQGNGGRIVVWFDERETVARKIYLPAAWDPPLRDRLRHWLGL